MGRMNVGESTTIFVCREFFPIIIDNGDVTVLFGCGLSVLTLESIENREIFYVV